MIVSQMIDLLTEFKLKYGDLEVEVNYETYAYRSVLEVRFDVKRNIIVIEELGN